MRFFTIAASRSAMSGSFQNSRIASGPPFFMWLT